jgi:parallel beta-helix repeat protein
MIRIAITVFFIYLLNVVAQAQTIIKNKQEVSGKWTIQGSPYIIEGEAFVPYGKNLDIQPGVKVKFKTGNNCDYSSENFNVGILRVRGSLSAIGKEKEKIVFTREGKHGYGGMILFDNSTARKNCLKYCIVEYGQAIYNLVERNSFYGAVSLYKSKALIEYSAFIYNDNTGIHCERSNPIIRYNVMARNTAGILVYNSSLPVIENNTIVNNYYGVMFRSSNTSIKNCILWKNINAFDVYLSTPSVSWSLLQGDDSGKVKDAGNNIFRKDPIFHDPENNDYSLSEISPCKKAGEKRKDIGGRP